MYPDFLPTRYDMEDIPPEMLAELVDDYVAEYETSYLPNVLTYMNQALNDMLFAEDHSSGFNEEFLQYQSFGMNFEFIETIIMDPFLETYYGVSYTANKEKLKEYEEENNAPYPENRLFNGGKVVTNKKVRTLVVIKKNIDTEFGFEVRSLYELDRNSKYVSEFIKN